MRPFDYSLDTPLCKIKYAREAAAVRRCHTIPILNHYEVGGHSFNMLTMLRVLWPDAPIALLWAITAHDLPERLTGDIPSPPKWFGVVDRNLLSDLELKIGVAISQPMPDLTDEENQWLMGLDLLELYMFAFDQRMLGNQNLQTMINRIEYVLEEMEWMPMQIQMMFTQLRGGFAWTMSKDLGDPT